VVAVILIPLLLFGIELIILGFAIAAGIMRRGLLGRAGPIAGRGCGSCSEGSMRSFGPKADH
jgi:hypothetical protein